MIQVPPDTKELLYERMVALSTMAEEQRAQRSAAYYEPDPIWALLEPRPYPSGVRDAPIVLLSASWLRTQKPTRLPPRHQLPPEAIVPAQSLRAIAATIDKGLAKGMSRPLPIIAVVHPRMHLGGGGASATPGADGAAGEGATGGQRRGIGGGVGSGAAAAATRTRTLRATTWSSSSRSSTRGGLRSRGGSAGRSRRA